MRRGWLLALPLLALIWLLVAPPGRAEHTVPTPLIVGAVRDAQNVPVPRATVTLMARDDDAALGEATTQADGRFALTPEAPLPTGAALRLRVERAHFRTTTLLLDDDAVAQLAGQQTIAVPDLTLARRISPAFWIATLVFAGMLAIIAVTELHNTLAALLGAVVVLGVSYLGRPLHEDLFIFDFESALAYVDWNVIFLVMGMMIVIAVVERTGIFQWLAFTSYRLSGGRGWLLLAVLMLVAGVTSAFLDNVTTMLLMTPISVQIALALGMNPLTLLIPEVMASNVVGVSTLVGTPTNILIGSYGNISFNDFLTNLTPGVLLAFAGLFVYSLVVYRKDLRQSGEISDMLLARLEGQARIAEPENLRKAGWVGLAMLLLFVLGERIHLLPAVTALMGATALLLWIRPDVEAMIDAVDWTTLVFFIALFVVVGAIQEVGLISQVASAIGALVGASLPLAMLVIIWLGAVLSSIVANIPFTAAMLPVIGFLTGTVPGAESKALYYCLSVGSAMGGNGSLIGASANLVTAGIAERAGYPITYGYFLKKGAPALVITVALASLWLLWRFLIAG